MVAVPACSAVVIMRPFFFQSQRLHKSMGYGGNDLSHAQLHEGELNRLRKQSNKPDLCRPLDKSIFVLFLQFSCGGIDLSKTDKTNDTEFYKIASN